MKNDLITKVFSEKAVIFTDGAYIHATQVANLFDRKVLHFLRLESTEQYIEAILARLNAKDAVSQDHREERSTFEARIEVGSLDEISNVNAVVVTIRDSANAGTWIHPKLAVEFCRWLSIDFAVWANDQIEDILHRDSRARSEAGAAMNLTLERAQRMLKDIEDRRDSALYQKNAAEKETARLDAEWNELYKQLERTKAEYARCKRYVDNNTCKVEAAQARIAKAAEFEEEKNMHADDALEAMREVFDSLCEYKTKVIPFVFRNFADRGLKGVEEKLKEHFDRHIERLHRLQRTAQIAGWVRCSPNASRDWCRALD